MSAAGTHADVSSRAAAARSVAPVGTARRSRLDTAWLQGVLIIAACAALYWIGLGSTGFSSSEGHRVGPAWEMLDHGHWLTPQLFGQAYLRKPPGMPWAICVFSEIFGRTEFAARAVSATAATLSALVALWFGRRWFGPHGGLYAGLAQALCPFFWPAARSAEIESLHNLCVQVAGLALVDILIAPWATSGATRRVRTIAMIALIAAGTIAAGLAKGPAAAPLLGGIAAAAIASGRLTRARAAASASALGIAGVVLGVLAWAIWRALGDRPAITQGVDEFLWRTGRWWATLLLAPAALLAAMPATLAMTFPWGPDARREAELADERGGEAGAASLLVARGLTVSVLVYLAILTCMGVDNPRYAMPGLMLAAPVAGYVGAGLRGGFIRKRPGIARVMCLGHPAVLPLCLVIGGVVWIHRADTLRHETSGRDAGQALAALLPSGATVWADELVEARPEVLLYARGAHDSPESLDIRWRPLGGSPLPPPGTYMVLRDDALSSEWKRYASAGLLDRFDVIGEGRVHKYTFKVLRAR